MSTSKKAGIENASEVIERFGGIRPMAKKMDVAVTTVQGWKKRDVIPDTRREQVLQAAATHDVDLSGVIDGASVANQNDKVEEKASVDAEEIRPVEAQVPRVEKTVEAKIEKDEPKQAQKDVEPAAPAQKDIAKEISGAEKRAIAKSTWINVVLLILGLGAVVALLWPQKDKPVSEDPRLSALEKDVQDVKEQQSFFGTLIPEDLSAQLEGLKEQAGQAQEQIGYALDKAQEISEDVLAENAGDIEQRLTRLEAHVSDISGSPVLAGLLDKFKGMSSSLEGQGQLDQIMSELAALSVASDADRLAAVDEAPEGEAQPATREGVFESTLDAARQQSASLNEAFGDVPTTDLKAAALLLGMSQFRSSLNRDNDAFSDDLNVLKNLIGDEDPELQAAIEKLAPHAQSGVLTPSGLSGEFRTLAGEAVVESLKGEDVSFQEKAAARFNELFQVEKDGELLTGTDTQATLQKTESFLNEGDLASAIIEAESLEGPAADVMAPWISKARVTLMAQKVQGLLGQAMDVKAYGSAAGAAAGAVQGLGGGMIHDEDSGLRVYRPKASVGGALDGFEDANPFDE